VDSGLLQHFGRHPCLSPGRVVDPLAWTIVCRDEHKGLLELREIVFGLSAGAAIRRSRFAALDQMIPRVADRPQTSLNSRSARRAFNASALVERPLTRLRPFERDKDTGHCICPGDAPSASAFVVRRERPGFGGFFPSGHTTSIADNDDLIQYHLAGHRPRGLIRPATCGRKPAIHRSAGRPVAGANGISVTVGRKPLKLARLSAMWRRFANTGAASYWLRNLHAGRTCARWTSPDSSD